MENKYVNDKNINDNKNKNIREDKRKIEKSKSNSNLAAKNLKSHDTQNENTDLENNGGYNLKNDKNNGDNENGNGNSKNSQNNQNDKSERNDEINPPPQPNEQPIQEDSPVNEHHTEQIEQTGSVLTCRGNKIIHCLTIIGQIEGHYILPSQNKTTKYEHIIPLLVSIDEDPRINGLLILLNTVGGDVEAGLAIAELISGMKKPTVSIVLGGGHSIGIPLAVASDKSFIAKSASMTVHPVRTTGLTLGVPQTFEYFRKMQDRITTFVCENSNISKERYNELVLNTSELVTDIGTILEGQEAVNEGLIDAVGTLSDATDCLYKMIDEYYAN